MTSSISWPSSLPKPLLSGTQTEAASLTIRSETDYGPAKVRRRTSANPIPTKTSIIVTSQQRDTLLEFYYETIDAGVLPFVMVDPVSGINAEFRLRSAPKITPLGPRTSTPYQLRVDLDLEQLPPIGGIVTIIAGPTCLLMSGLAGVFQFSEDGEITVESRAFCVNAGVVSAEDTEEIVLPFAQVNTDGGENVSIDWEYTDADGTSRVSFHRDTGWSYELQPEHAATPSGACSGGGSAFVKLSGDESLFPGFRDFSIPALNDESAKTLCQSGGVQINPVFYRLATTATLDNATCPTPASRAQGFRDYLWACSTGGVIGDDNEPIPTIS